MNHTTNYQLSQWAASDRIQRTDFNADNAKIDAALKTQADALSAAATAIPELAVGTYTGNGAAERTISLPFTPKAVYICTCYGITFSRSVNYSDYYGGLFLAESPLGSGENIFAKIVTGGIRVYHKTSGSSTYSTNSGNLIYHYIAMSW